MQYMINSVAPIRICDLGGWTDTWFAGHGRIFNIGVYPYVEVQLTARRAELGSQERIVIHAENYGERYALPPGGRAASGVWGPHPLLEAAIETMRLPDDLAFEATIYSEAPAGMSTGTSAAVSVALIGALDCLTPAQGGLHPALVSADARRVIEIGRAHGAIGWKVNGAGGEGGSLTLLCGARSDAKRAMLAAIESEDKRFRNIPIYLSRYGLRVWQRAD